MKPSTRSLLVDLTGVAGAVCVVNGARLLHEAAAWILGGAMFLALWLWSVLR